MPKAAPEEALLCQVRGMERHLGAQMSPLQSAPFAKDMHSYAFRCSSSKKRIPKLDKQVLFTS